MSSRSLGFGRPLRQLPAGSRGLAIAPRAIALAASCPPAAAASHRPRGQSLAGPGTSTLWATSRSGARPT
eukprot:5336283-Alexandrium_andersonii.AAC.1